MSGSGGIGAYMPKSMSIAGRMLLKSTIAGGSLDLMDLDQGAAVSAPTFPQFRFSTRRSRIDWRILHGVDVNAIVRDFDLDTLEKVVGIVANGDIEAEDTRHLTELNFVKIFRLAQLVVEYLLYVQECLQSTNTWLQTEKVQLEKYISASRQRLRELDSHHRTAKRELRRARRTAKTYETMVALGKLPGDTGSKAAADKDTIPAVKAEPAALAISPMEVVLRQELLTLADRLSRAHSECAQLRSEREELAGCVKEIDTLMKNKGLGLPSKPSASAETELRSAKDQLTRAWADVKMLRAEKDEIQNQLESAQTLNKVLQGEKEALLQEMNMGSSYPLPEQAGDGDAAGVSGDGRSKLNQLYLDSEKQRKDLTTQVQELNGCVAKLQRELMKAQKDAAVTKPAVPAPGVMEELTKSLAASETARNDLANRCAELERELSDKRRAHDEDVKNLQDELYTAHQSLGQLRTQLALGTGTAQKGGFIKVDEKAEDLQVQLAAKRQECTSLSAQVSELHSANSRLNELVATKEQALQSAWGLVKELQGQLAVPSGNRDPQAVGRVRAQVQEFELVAQAASGAMAAALPPPSPTPSPGPAASHASPAASTPRAAEPADSYSPGPATATNSPHNSSFKFARPGQTAGATGSAQNVTGPSTPGMLARSALMAAANQAAVVERHAVPSPAQASAIKQELMKRVQGKTHDELASLIEEELRAVSEHPYEYQDDDEARFRALLPYEVQPDVLAAKPHPAQDLSVALGLYGASTLSKLDEAVWSYGIDPTVRALSDKEYAAVMMEVNHRREMALGRLSNEQREQAEFLRDALFTHLELAKRKAEHTAATGGPASAHTVSTRLVDPAARSFPAATHAPADRGASPSTHAATVHTQRTPAGATSSPFGAANTVAGKQAGALVTAAYSGAESPTGPQSLLPSSHFDKRSSGGHIDPEVTLSDKQALPAMPEDYKPPGVTQSGAQASGARSSLQQSLQQTPAAPGPSSSSVGPTTTTAEGSFSQAPARITLSPSLGSLNQSLRQPSAALQEQAAAAAAGEGGSLLNQSLTRSSQALQNLNQSLSRGGQPLNQSLGRGAQLNQSLTAASAAGPGSGAGATGGIGPSRLSSGLGPQVTVTGSPATAAGSPAQTPNNQSLRGPTSPAAAVSVLNASMPKSGSNSALNQTSGRRSNDSPNRLLGSIRAGGGIANLNASLRSAGTGKASLRDYSTHDFDDASSDDEDVATSRHAQARDDGGYDEYSVGAEEEDEMDPGVLGMSGGMTGAALPVAGKGWGAVALPMATVEQERAPAIDRTPSRSDPVPSRLARVTGGGDDDMSGASAQQSAAAASKKPAIPDWLRDDNEEVEEVDGDEEEGDDEWDDNRANPQRILSAQEQEAAQHAAYAAHRKASVAAAASMQQSQAATDAARRLVSQASGGWTTGPANAQPGSAQRASKGRDSDHSSEQGSGYDIGSVRSFHPNDTNSSLPPAAARAVAAANAHGAWGSPEATQRRQVPGYERVAGTDAGSSATSLGNRWNETIQTITSTVTDEVQTFEQSLGRGQQSGGAWTSGAGRPGGVAGSGVVPGARGGGTRGAAADSEDDVSEVEYF